MNTYPDDSNFDSVDINEDDSDFDDVEMDFPTHPPRHRFIIDLLLSHTFRIPKQVTKVRIYRDRNMFAVCPRSDNSMEYEYQLYCGWCGQCLDWSKLDEADEEFIGWNGVEPEDDDEENGNRNY